MFSFLHSLYPSAIKPPTTIGQIKAICKYGISSTIDFLINSSGSISKGERRNAFNGNITSPMGKYKGFVIDDVVMTEGMNTEMLNTASLVDWSIVADSVVKARYIKSDYHSLVASMFADHVGENACGLLYNLLRMYYGTDLIKVNYEPNAAYYDDGHIKVRNAQFFGMVEDPENYRVEGPTVKNSGYFNFAQDGSMPDGEFLFSATNCSRRVLSLISYAAGAWNFGSHIAVMHDSPALTNKTIFMTNQRGATTGDESDFVDLRSFNKAEIADVLGRIVHDNRLFAQFDIAYGMLTQVLMNHRPRSVESIYWFSKPIPVYIPRLKAVRGMFPKFIDGCMFVRDKMLLSTFKQWRAAPQAAFWHSITLSEAVYTEMYSMTITDDPYTKMDELFGYERFTLGHGLFIDTVLAASRYARDVKFYDLYACGADRFAIIREAYGGIEIRVDVTDVMAIQSYKRLVPTGTDMLGIAYDAEHIVGRDRVMRLQEITPLVYPFLSFGVNTSPLFGNDYDVTAHGNIDRYTSTMSFDDIVEYNKMMSAFRLAGWDVIGMNTVSQERMHNWGDNASGRFAYTPPKSDGPVQMRIDLNTLTRREHYWLDIPVIGETIEFNYKLSNPVLTWFGLNNKPELLKSYDVGSYEVKPQLHGVDIDRQTEPMVSFRPVATVVSDFRRIGSLGVTGRLMYQIGIGLRAPQLEEMPISVLAGAYVPEADADPPVVPPQPVPVV
jgi:hypothetical protein